MFPAYFPLTCPDPLACEPVTDPRGGESRRMRRRLRQHTPRIDPADWPTIAERARHDRLRDRAGAYGVSHETIRAIVRQVRLSACESALAADYLVAR